MSFIAAAIIGGGAVVGGIAGAIGSSNAAGDQESAAKNAAQVQQNEFNTITQQESPYMQSGYGSLSQLDYLLGVGSPGQAGSAGKGGVGGTPGTASSSPYGGYGSLLTPFNASMMKQYSPAYQFQLQQGQQGVLNQDAASQGSLSGASLKDLLSFNQNYANTAFNNAFNQYQTQQGNTFNRLFGVAQSGQTAAANTGQQGSALAGNIGSAIVGGGAAQAAGQVGVANAIGGAASSASYLPWLLSGSGSSVPTGGGMTPQQFASAPALDYSGP